MEGYLERMVFLLTFFSYVYPLEERTSRGRFNICLYTTNESYTDTIIDDGHHAELFKRFADEHDDMVQRVAAVHEHIMGQWLP